jgi:hypothetical protein
VVIAGMLTATLIAVFLIPMLFVLVERLRGYKTTRSEGSSGLVPGESPS